MCSITVGGFTSLLYMGCMSLLDASACDARNICSVYSTACRGCPTVQRRCCRIFPRASLVCLCFGGNIPSYKEGCYRYRVLSESSLLKHGVGRHKTCTDDIKIAKKGAHSQTVRTT